MPPAQRARWQRLAKYHPKPRSPPRTPAPRFRGYRGRPPIMLLPLWRWRRRPTSCYATCCSRSPTMLGPPSQPQSPASLPNSSAATLAKGSRKIRRQFPSRPPINRELPWPARVSQYRLRRADSPALSNVFSDEACSQTDYFDAVRALIGNAP